MKTLNLTDQQWRYISRSTQRKERSSGIYASMVLLCVVAGIVVSLFAYLASMGLIQSLSPLYLYLSHRLESMPAGTTYMAMLAVGFGLLLMLRLWVWYRERLQDTKNGGYTLSGIWPRYGERGVLATQQTTQRDYKRSMNQSKGGESVYKLKNSFYRGSVIAKMLRNDNERREFEERYQKQVFKNRSKAARANRAGRSRERAADEREAWAQIRKILRSVGLDRKGMRNMEEEIYG